jgi:transposase-like protein
MPRAPARHRKTDLPSLKRRWTPEDARAVLAELEASGLSLREFAEREGLDRQRLYRWRAQIGVAAEPTFIEIARPSSGAVIEVVLRSGHMLRVPAGFEAETVRRLVAILGDEAAAC